MVQNDRYNSVMTISLVVAVVDIPLAGFLCKGRFSEFCKASHEDCALCTTWLPVINMSSNSNQQTFVKMAQIYPSIVAEAPIPH